MGPSEGKVIMYLDLIIVKTKIVFDHSQSDVVVILIQ